MATTGAANAFVLNITELQNTVTTASGLTPYDTLSAQIGQIEQMVIVDEKRIAVDTISAYTNGATIQVVDPINIGPTGGLTVAGASISEGTGIGPTGPMGPTGPIAPTGPTGPLAPYTVGASGNWVPPVPTNIITALSRMEALLVSLNGNNPIP
jgi:hypothetical protein